MGRPFNANLNFTITDVNQEILPIKEGREFLVMQNTSTTNKIYVNFSNAAVAGDDLVIGPGGNIYLDNEVPTDTINMICDSGKTAKVIIQEA